MSNFRKAFARDMHRLFGPAPTGHRPVAAPPRTTAAPPAPPAGPAGVSRGLPSWMATAPLPVEAQIFLRIMGEDMATARGLTAALAPVDRRVMMFYVEQMAAMVYEIEEGGS